MPPETRDGPYVGPEPFGPDERLLFRGRDREAGFVRDKVLAARLTVLYGPACVGKSSLLRASVMHGLDERGAFPIYFDSWTSEDPKADLRRAVVAAATRAGVSDAGAGSPSVTELVKLINSATERTVVLILDQFEELLLREEVPEEAVRKELVALVRAQGADVRVLIALRQECLAALEPFRAEILDLFSSTYVLRPLDEAFLREAIEVPATGMGATCEPGFAGAVIKDLSRSQGVEMVELPKLQIVCAQVWRAMRRAGGEVMTVQRYQQLGGADRILEAYVRDLMPRSRSERLFVARLMQQLAPRSGNRVAFSVEGFPPVGRHTKAHLEAELRRLEERGVLRAGTFSAGPRYELRHDSLMRLVTSWSETELAQARRARNLAWALGAPVIAVGAAVLLAVYVTALHRYQFYKNAEQPLATLEESEPRKIAARFDQVASYALYQYKGGDKYDQISKLMKQYARRIPADYGLPGAGDDILPNFKADSTITVHYSRLRGLDQARFTAGWKTEAVSTMGRWGIPVPMEVSLVEEPAYPEQQIKIEVKRERPLFLNVENYQANDRALVAARDMVNEGHRFFEALPEADRKPAKEMPKEAGWYLVPRWSLPVWKAAGVDPIDASRAVAMAVVAGLLKEPDRLLSEETVQYLLYRTAQEAPGTVAEARAIRGGALRGDLIELVRKERPLRDLTSVLDSLARYPGMPSEEVARRVELELKRGAAVGAEYAMGPKLALTAADAPERGGEPDELLAAAEPWMPSVAQLRVYIGLGLMPAWVRKGVLVPGIADQTEAVGQELFDRYGVVVPEPLYLPDARLAGSAFRVEVLDEMRGDRGAPTVAVSPPSDQAVFADILRAREASLRARWISADFVEAELGPPESRFRIWLESTYSITDLKLMLREVVAPSSDAVRRCGGSPEEAPPPAGSPCTIRHTPWLLRSLVFWTAAEDKGSLRSLAGRLVETQHARLAAPIPRPPLRMGEVERGLSLLDGERVAEAHEAFASAVKANRELAIQVFLETYPARVRRQLAAVEQACLQHEYLRGLQLEERSNVVELLDSGWVDSRRDLELRYCLFRDGNQLSQRRELELAAELLRRHGDPSEWQPVEAWSFSTWLRKTRALQPRPDPSGLAFHALSQMTRGEAQARFSEQVRACNDEEGNNLECRSWLARLAAQRPDDLAVPYVEVLISSDRSEDLAKAEELVSAIKSPDVNTRCLQAAVRAKRSMEPGAPWSDRDQESIRLLVEQRSCGPGLAHILFDALFAAGKQADAERMADLGLRRTPHDADLMMDKVWIALDRGNRELAGEIASRAEAMARKLGVVDDPDLLNVAAVTNWLIDAKGWQRTTRRFLDTGHQNVPYLAMALSSSLVEQRFVDKAAEVLDAYWKDVDEATIHARLREGDERAWRELLIRYYRGEEPWADIIRPLEDPAAFGASEYGHTRFSREGMLTEALFYDALLAKAHGDEARYHQDLNRVVALEKHNYLEYDMAKYLVRRPPAVQ